MVAWHRRRMKGTGKRPPMIKAKKVTIDGIRFDSQLEGHRYEELKRRQAAGLIRDLEAHPEYSLVIEGRPVMIRSARAAPRRAKYTADFKYWDVEADAEVVEDVKGYDTPIARLRRSVAECIYQMEVIVVVRSKQ